MAGGGTALQGAHTAFGPIRPLFASTPRAGQRGLREGRGRLVVRRSAVGEVKLLVSGLVSGAAGGLTLGTWQWLKPMAGACRSHSGTHPPQQLLFLEAGLYLQGESLSHTM